MYEVYERVIIRNARVRMFQRLAILLTFFRPKDETRTVYVELTRRNTSQPASNQEDRERMMRHQ